MINMNEKMSKCRGSLEKYIPGPAQGLRYATLDKRKGERKGLKSLYEYYYTTTLVVDAKRRADAVRRVNQLLNRVTMAEINENLIFDVASPKDNILIRKMEGDKFEVKLLWHGLMIDRPGKINNFLAWDENMNWVSVRFLLNQKEGIKADTRLWLDIEEMRERKIGIR